MGVMELESDHSCLNGSLLWEIAKLIFLLDLKILCQPDLTPIVKIMKLE
jgi:hypothetical protein